VSRGHGLQEAGHEVVVDTGAVEGEEGMTPAVAFVMETWK